MTRRLKLKTWDDIKRFDDIVLTEEREIISDLEREEKRRCPYLEREGGFFYYCRLNIPEVRDKEPSPSHPIYQRHVDVIEMQLHCISDFETCCFYSGKLKR